MQNARVLLTEKVLCNYLPQTSIIAVIFALIIKIIWLLGLIKVMEIGSDARIEILDVYVMSQWTTVCSTPQI